MEEFENILNFLNDKYIEEINGINEIIETSIVNFINGLYDRSDKEHIYGTIGYTILKNNNNKVIIFSDMHDTLKYCSKYITIGKWLKKKSKDSIILLEEVDRTKVKLKQLWPDAPHTQELKNLYLDNKDVIVPVDIRPQLIPFSWETLECFKSDDEKACNMLLKEWLSDLISFFELKNIYINDKLGDIYDKETLEHFGLIQSNFKEFMYSNFNFLDKKIGFIALNKPDFIDKINAILSDAMEWFSCALIKKNNNNKMVIIHAGLAHTTKINKWLSTIYGYENIKNYGLVDITESEERPEHGCVEF